MCSRYSRTLAGTGCCLARTLRADSSVERPPWPSCGPPEGRACRKGPRRAVSGVDVDRAAAQAVERFLELSHGRLEFHPQVAQIIRVQGDSSQFHLRQDLGQRKLDFRIKLMHARGLELGGQVPMGQGPAKGSSPAAPGKIPPRAGLPAGTDPGTKPRASRPRRVRVPPGRGDAGPGRWISSHGRFSRRGP